MNVGTVKETKRHEYRVGLTPDCVKSYCVHGHTVWVERGAGIGAGFEDDEYSAAGARLVDDAAAVWDQEIEAMVVLNSKWEGLTHNPGYNRWYSLRDLRLKQ